jgi:hypothetical protein
MFLPPGNEVSVGGRAGEAGRGVGGEPAKPGGGHGEASRSDAKETQGPLQARSDPG